MKQISIVLGVVSLVLIGVLFYLHFTHTEKLNKVTDKATKNAGSSFKIAYFDIDSLQSNYEHYKDMLEELKKAEQSHNARLNNLRTSYQNFVGELQKSGPGMTQAQQEQAQRELARKEKEYQKTESDLQNDMQDMQMKKIKELQQEIESYLADYNKQKGYAYIFSYQPGMLLYYRDSAYNITSDVLKGLNERYSIQKKN